MYVRPVCRGCSKVFEEGVVVQGAIFHPDSIGVATGRACGGLIGDRRDMNLFMRDVPQTTWCRPCFEQAVGWSVRRKTAEEKDDRP
jgi:hypothetical protein